MTRTRANTRGPVISLGRKRAYPSPPTSPEDSRRISRFPAKERSCGRISTRVNAPTCFKTLKVEDRATVKRILPPAQIHMSLAVRTNYPLYFSILSKEVHGILGEYTLFFLLRTGPQSWSIRRCRRQQTFPMKPKPFIERRPSCFLISC